MRCLHHRRGQGLGRQNFGAPCFPQTPRLARSVAASNHHRDDMSLTIFGCPGRAKTLTGIIYSPSSGGHWWSNNDMEHAS